MAGRSSFWAMRSLRGAFNKKEPLLPLVSLTSQTNLLRHQASLSRRAFMYMSSTAAALTLSSTLTKGRRGLFLTAFSEYSTTSTTTTTEAQKGPEVLLYQYEVCPFCNKVRAYLDFHDVPYRVVEVDPLRKTELKHLPEDYRKVPIAIINGKQVNGSANVIDTVHSLLSETDPTHTTEEQHWLSWLDDHLIHLIAPNIYRTASESLQTFNYIAENAKFSAFQRATIRYTGAMAMYFIGRKKKRQYAIEDERTAIHTALKDWTDTIREGGGKFLSGSETPSVADLSIYGVLKAIQRFDTFSELLEQNAELAQWYDRTQVAVGESSLTSRE